MRKMVFTLALVLGLIMAVAAPLGAAELHEPHQGTACGHGYEATWHFVNNQTDRSGAGYLVVTTDAGTTAPLSPSKVNRNTQHWWVVGGHTLIDASTNLPGKLVLSEYSCRRIKKSDT